MIHYDYIITSYCRDIIVFFINTIFDNPFGVKCKHCGNESESLWLKEGEVKELEDIPVFISNTLNDLGNLYLEQLSYVKALRFHKISYELWIRGDLNKNGIELGNKSLLIAKVFHGVKDVKNETIQLRKTIEILECCISNSKSEKETKEAKQLLKQALKQAEL